MTKNRTHLKEWYGLIEENKKKWAKELYELILKDSYWDVTFDRYSKYRVFTTHFEREIKEILSQARKQFPDMKMAFEDVAHDLFLSVTEDDEFIEKFAEDLDTITNQILKTLPKA